MVAHLHVLFPHVSRNVIVRVFQHGLGSVKLINPLLIGHAIHLAVPVYDAEGIVVCMRTIHHESLEVRPLDALGFFQNTICASISSDCMLQHAMVITRR